MSKVLDNPAWSPETRAAMIQVAVQEDADQFAHTAKLMREREATRQRRDAELAKQAEFFKRQRAKEIADEQKKLREDSAKNLEADLRGKFFSANPNALESDYDRVKDRLKDEYFFERMKGWQTTKEIFTKSSVKM